MMFADPCDCAMVEGCGWSTRDGGCANDGTTRCYECPTVSNDCITGTCASFSDGTSCPMDYNEERVCQCNAECEMFGNCCADVDTGCESKFSVEKTHLRDA